MINLRHTPIETYFTGPTGRTRVLVKREDLCTPEPGPNFSKMRGIVKRLETLKRQGYTTVGYTETSISMAGWGVAWAAQEIGLHVVIFDPQYKEYVKKPDHLKLLDAHRNKWIIFGAELVPLPAGRAKVNFHIGKKLLDKMYPNRSVMLPLGLSLPETVEEVGREAQTIPKNIRTIVVNVGSGTICAGILRGLSDRSVLVNGILGRTGNIYMKHKHITELDGSLFSMPALELFDPGYEYTEPENFPAPFPCHRYYDRKAWAWLAGNSNRFSDPILFWNIGGEESKLHET